MPGRRAAHGRRPRPGRPDLDTRQERPSGDAGSGRVTPVLLPVAGPAPPLLGPFPTGRVSPALFRQARLFLGRGLRARFDKARVPVLLGVKTATPGAFGDAFGAFVEVLPGKDGLVPIRDLADYYVERVEDVVKEGDVIEAFEIRYISQTL